MATDADVSFKKARIKRNISGGVRPYGFHLDGRTFVTEDTSLTDLISYAYEVHAKQIVGGPDWMDRTAMTLMRPWDRRANQAISS